ncbi:hypothetical protein HanRHA438_Chr09g0404241 [Helianthus annuus]|nr:hypothetical protein HanIR_Chr09g0423331 [Helianthus annuus]KAJ0888644.1 hypothetical protein HanRHA438_Chr09g0404241 [Helianthus annuus]
MIRTTIGSFEEEKQLVSCFSRNERARSPAVVAAARVKMERKMVKVVFRWSICGGGRRWEKMELSGEYCTCGGF